MEAELQARIFTIKLRYSLLPYSLNVVATACHSIITKLDWTGLSPVGILTQCAVTCRNFNPKSCRDWNNISDFNCKNKVVFKQSIMLKCGLLKVQTWLLLVLYADGL